MVERNIKCSECEKIFYCKESHIQRFNNLKHFCSLECKNLYHSKYMILNSPMKGKHQSEYQKQIVRECSIGKKFKKGDIPWNKGLKGFMSGESSPSWKGGLSKIDKSIRQIPEWDKLDNISSNTLNKDFTSNTSNTSNSSRANELNELNEQKKDITAIQNLSKFTDSELWLYQKRAGGSTQMNPKCSVMGCFLEAHHLEQFKIILMLYGIKNLKEARECSKLWDIDNGQTLCIECHNKTRGRKLI